MKSTRSYNKVAYDVRPGKQIERRMLLDAFQLLAVDGFPMRSYQYTGMGSVFFYDYVLFHKLLGINDMVSAEMDKSIERRVRFNVPFSGVQVRMTPIGEEIPRLSKDKRHILWLDYDDYLRNYHLADVVEAASHLSRDSILLVTIDAEPVGGGDSKANETLEHFQAEADAYLPAKPRPRDFTRAALPSTIAQIISRAISRGLAARDVTFVPLFNFVYADGHQMVTVGGMFVAHSDVQKLTSGSISQANYIRMDLAVPPLSISIPNLTRRERQLLDSNMPLRSGWECEQFEISEASLEAYSKIYRYLPAYGELLV